MKHLHAMEFVRARHAETPQVVKRVIRLCRRARQHGITDYETPVFADTRQPCQVRIGSRVVLVFSDGSHVPSLRPASLPGGGWLYDKCALNAHYNRWHATWLELAGNERRVASSSLFNGGRYQALRRSCLDGIRSNITIAVEDRRRREQEEA